jgi:hypothetical protein
MVTALKPPALPVRPTVPELPQTRKSTAAEPALWLVVVFLRWLQLILGGIAVFAAIGLFLYRRWLH